MGRNAQRSLILASASPRRRELLESAGWRVVARPVEVDERPQPGETPENLVRRLALAKAQHTAFAVPELVLGADTVVVDGERVLGKPSDEAEARQMLRSLANKTHRVLTGLALLNGTLGEPQVEICETGVPMRAYSEQEIDAYIASGAPFDKAGGYGIQDEGFRPVALEKFAGCFANVMGLPLCCFERMLQRLGIEPPVAASVACQQLTRYRCCLVALTVGAPA